MSALLDRVVGAALEPPDTPVPVTDVAWPDLRAEVLDERVIGLLAAAVGRAAVAVDPAVDAEIAELTRRAMVDAVILERVAVQTIAPLRAAGLDVRLTKGAAVAHLDYPDPSWRCYGDVDLVVAAADYDEVVRRLVATGGRRRSSEVRPGFDRRFGKGTCIVRPDGYQVDVHRSFASGPFGVRLAMDRVLATTDSVVLGGTSIPVLTPPARFLHACVHAALGNDPARVGALADVVVMARRRPQAALDGVALGIECGVGAVMAEAITTAWGRLAVATAPVAEWAARWRTSRADERALRAYRGADRSYARQMAAAVGSVPGVRARAVYVGSLMFPSRAHTSVRDAGHWRRWQRALRSRTAAREVAR